MSKISDIAQNYRPPSSTVTVMLSPNDKAVRRREELLREITEAQKPKPGDRLTKKSPVDELRAELEAVEATEAQFMRTLRFTKLDGLAFAALTAEHPPRETVPFDLQLGFNHHAGSLSAAKLNGVDVTDVAEGVPLDDDDWKVIFTVGSGIDVENIVQTVLELNVMRSMRTIGRLKKG